MQTGNVCGAGEVVTTVVPYWIMDALRRNNFNTMDIFDYGKLRKMLSIEDMAQFLCVVNGAYLAKFKDSSLNYLRGSYVEFEKAISNTMTTEQKLEMDEVIQPLISAQATKDAVIDRLSDLKFGARADEEYQTVIDADSKFIVVTIKRGILNALEDRAYLLKCVSDYLKALYTHVSTEVVASTYPYKTVFASYIGQLKSSVATL